MEKKWRHDRCNHANKSMSLGYKFVADIVITTSVNNIKEVMDSLKTKSYIVLGGDPFRRFKIEIFVVLTKIKELAKIQEELESNPLIKETGH